VEESGKLGNSDHVAILTRVMVGKKRKQEGRMFKRWNLANFEGMGTELSLIDWENLLNNGPVEQSWRHFRSLLENSINRHIPTGIFKDSSKPRWLTRDLIKLIRHKKRAWKIYRTDQSAEARENYMKLEKEVKNKIRKAKRRLERELTKKDDRNGRNFTNYIKSKMQTRTGIGPLKNVEGRIRAENREMANILNEFMSSVFTREDTSSLPVKNIETEQKISDIVITEAKIKEIIDNLKKDSAPGPDGIHPRLLKELKEVLARPLKILFKKSLATGEVPADWRTARVIPIYKKGPKSDPGNYRPVSLTSITMQAIERPHQRRNYDPLR
jgi:hypothetical protein